MAPLLGWSAEDLEAELDDYRHAVGVPSAGADNTASLMSRMRPQVVAHRGASYDNAEHTLARVHQGPRARRRRTRVRCPADRRWPPGVRPRPRPAAHREPPGCGVRDGARDPPASSTSQPGGARRRVSSTRPPTVTRSSTACSRCRRLFETVAAYDRPVELAVETKHPTRYAGLVERRLVDLLQEFGWQQEGSPVRVMSFSYLALQRVRRLAPGLRQGDAVRARAPLAAAAAAGRGRLDRRPLDRHAAQAP